MLKEFNFLLLNKNSILFTLCMKISKQYLGYYPKYSLFNLKGSKSEVTKSLHFSETTLISFGMLNNGRRYFVIRNAWNSRWVSRQTQWRPLQKFFIGGSLPGVCLWMDPLWLKWGRVYFSSDCLWVQNHFPCFITVIMWLFPRDDTLCK